MKKYSLTLSIHLLFATLIFKPIYAPANVNFPTIPYSEYPSTPNTKISNPAPSEHSYGSCHDSQRVILAPYTPGVERPFYTIESRFSCNCYCKPKVFSYDLPLILETAFSQNLDIFDEDQVILGRWGQFVQQLAKFDAQFQQIIGRERQSIPVHNEFASPPTNIGHNKIFSTDYQLSIEKLFPTGIRVRPLIHINKVNNNFLSPPRQTTGHSELVIEVPLMQGLGVENTAAEAIAAQFEYQASIFNWYFNVSKVLASVARLYWQYIFLAERIKIFDESIKRSEEFLRNLEIMVQHREIARTELQQVRADLANKREEKIKSEQDLYEAEQSLILLMALDPDDDINIYLKKYKFPTVDEVKWIDECVIQAWIDYAFEHRGDFLSFQKDVHASRALLRQAYNLKQPKLNIRSTTGFDGLSLGKGGFPNALSERVDGLNWREELILEIPICQSEARGLIYSRRAELSHRMIAVQRLFLQIRSNLHTLASAIQHDAAQLEETHLAAEEYYQALEDEKFKFLHGTSTVLSIIQIQDRLISTQLQENTQKFDFIEDIIKLRLESGTILNPNDCTFCLQEENLTSIPFIDVLKQGE